MRNHYCSCSLTFVVQNRKHVFNFIFHLDKRYPLKYKGITFRRTLLLEVLVHKRLTISPKNRAWNAFRKMLTARLVEQYNLNFLTKTVIGGDPPTNKRTKVRTCVATSDIVKWITTKDIGLLPSPRALASRGYHVVHSTSRTQYTVNVCWVLDWYSNTIPTSCVITAEPVNVGYELA